MIKATFWRLGGVNTALRKIIRRLIPAKGLTAFPAQHLAGMRKKLLTLNGLGIRSGRKGELLDQLPQIFFT